MKVILTGPIGSGKSTALRLAMKRLEPQAPHGYFTHKKSGSDSIVLETWRGERRICARRAASARPDSFPYTPDIEVFNDFAANTLMDVPEGGFAAVDELGVMELPAKTFAAAVAAIFRRQTGIIAVVQQRALDAWLAIIGRKHADRIIILDIANRNNIPRMIAELMRTEDQ